MEYDCFNLVADMRRTLNEYSTAYILGTDTTGKYKNDYLLRCLNRANRYLYSLLLKRRPEWFLESTTLTAVNSVFILPEDFGTVQFFTDTDGIQVFPMGVATRKRASETGTTRYYTRVGNTFVLDQDGVTDTYNLWYQRRFRDLIFASIGTGAAASLPMGAYASRINDYYNSIKVAHIDDTTLETDFIDTITDYTGSTQTAVISGTSVTDSWYGTFSEIPEEFHHLLSPKAVQIVKAEFPVAQEKPTRSEIAGWEEEFESVLSGFPSNEDIPIEEIFEDFSDA